MNYSDEKDNLQCELFVVYMSKLQKYFSIDTLRYGDYNIQS